MSIPSPPSHILASAPSSLADAAWLRRPETQAVLEMLDQAGHPARAVGGVVRNALLGHPVTDIDIATPATPDTVMRLAAAAGHRAVPTGIEHGTVTVIVAGHPFEVTTLRRDVSTDGRRATVAFTTDWAEDAARRDFTINALYCDRAGQVHDPLGGLADLAARRLRFIGDAEARIREDYLRILRFFRFHAQYAEGPLDGPGLAATVALRGGLDRLSGERIRQELVRLLVAGRAPPAVRTMCETGIMTALLHVAPRPDVFEHMCAIEAAVGAAPSAMLRLGALAGVVDEVGDALAAQLKLSRDERESLAAYCAAAGRWTSAGSAAAGRRALFLAGDDDRFRADVLTRWSAAGAAPDDATWRGLYELPTRWRAPVFPVSGGDVLALGVAPGIAVGQLLDQVRTAWIEEDFSSDRSALLKRLAAAANARS
jgi:tRNA nucleotidyltransferase/poly(A) polymerase